MHYVLVSYLVVLGGDKEVDKLLREGGGSWWGLGLGYKQLNLGLGLNLD